MPSPHYVRTISGGCGDDLISEWWVKGQGFPLAPTLPFHITQPYPMGELGT